MQAKVDAKLGQPGGAAKVSAGKLVVLQALAALLTPALEGRVSQDDIATHIGRKRASVGNTLAKLKKDGLIHVERSQSWGVPSRYVIPEVTYNLLAQYGGGKATTSDTLPDCFRTSDLNNAGRLWMSVPKGQELALSDILPFALCGRQTTINHLRALSKLAVPAVTLRPNPNKARAFLYTFHRLTAEQLLEIQADLSQRLPQWRPRTEAESRADHEQRKAELAAKVGPAAYVHKVREILELTKPDRETRAKGIPVLDGVTTDCWIYGGALSGGGYGNVDGVRTPGVKAHRITYWRFVGPIPRGHELHHVCRRPACVNPHHLVALTKQQHERATRLDRYGDKCRSIHEQYRPHSDEWVHKLADATRAVYLATGTNPSDCMPDEIFVELKTYTTNH